MITFDCEGIKSDRIRVRTVQEGINAQYDEFQRYIKGENYDSAEKLLREFPRVKSELTRKEFETMYNHLEAKLK